MLTAYDRVGFWVKVLSVNRIQPQHAFWLIKWNSVELNTCISVFFYVPGCAIEGTAGIDHSFFSSNYSSSPTSSFLPYGSDYVMRMTSHASALFRARSLQGVALQLQ